MEIVNSYSNRRLTRDNVIAAWAGLRPLIGPGRDEEDGVATPDDTSTLSREHDIFETSGGMIALIGGKLTNYRIMANEVVDKIVPHLSEDTRASVKQPRTHRLMLGGWADKSDFLTLTATISAAARKNSLEPATIEHLIASYGKDAMSVVEIVEKEPSLSSRICPNYPQIMAEVRFCVLNEMAVSLDDILSRRMRLGIVNQKECLKRPRKLQCWCRVCWDGTMLELKWNSRRSSGV